MDRFGDLVHDPMQNVHDVRESIPFNGSYWLKEKLPTIFILILPTNFMVSWLLTSIISDHGRH